MRKPLLIVTVSVLVLAGAASMAGITPRYLMAAAPVASGIGSKLLCSAVYVSGFSKEQAFDDLVQYSPVLDYLQVAYDDSRRTVKTSLFGLRPTTASYLPGIGCANEYPREMARHTLVPRVTPRSNAPWPAGDRVDTLDPEMQTLLEELVAQDNAQGLNTRAWLVAHEGKIIAEAYDQGAGPHTPLLGWSMTKSLTSLMVGNLVMRGLLDQDITPVFPRWENDSRQQITLTHLLTMSDGLAFSEDYSPGDDVTLMLFTQASATDYALSRRLQYSPGTHFSYSSGTANLLSRVHYEKTGANLQAAYDDYQTQIAGLLGFQDAVLESDARGVFVGSSYLYASARDWARMGQLMLAGGEINGQRVVSESWVQQSLQPNGTENDPAYGYQWWLNQGGESLRWPDLPRESFAAQGNRQQVVMVVPTKEIVMVRLGWTSGRYPINERMARIIQARAPQ